MIRAGDRVRMSHEAMEKLVDPMRNEILGSATAVVGQIVSVKFDNGYESNYHRDFLDFVCRGQKPVQLSFKERVLQKNRRAS